MSLSEQSQSVSKEIEKHKRRIEELQRKEEDIKRQRLTEEGRGSGGREADRAKRKEARNHHASHGMPAETRNRELNQRNQGDNTHFTQPETLEEGELDEADFIPLEQRGSKRHETGVSKNQESKNIHGHVTSK